MKKLSRKRALLERYADARYRLSPRGHWRPAAEIVECEPPKLRRAVIRYLQSDPRLLRKPTQKK